MNMKNTIIFELLTNSNIEYVRTIQRDDISEAFVDNADTIMELTQYGLDHNCKGHTYAIKKEDEYIGLILLGEAFEWDTDPEEMKGVPFYRLMGFVLDKRYRNCGIGGYVLEKVIEMIYNDYGIRPIALGVHKDNIGAERFYLNHGFKKTEVMEGNDYYYLRYPNKTMINCVWEHNGTDTLLYAVDYIGAYTRGESLDIAKAKMPAEILSYLKWCGENASNDFEIVITGEKVSDLNIKDADSDVLFESEKSPLTLDEYEKLKALALKSAKDFLALYESIPDKRATAVPERKTFYGNVPRSADEMYEHTKNVNEYYFTEIDVHANNNGSIYECRKRAFEQLETTADYLNNAVIEGSYGEYWSLRKVFRRFIWHDRIHAKAMYRMAVKVFGAENVKNPFYF